jgi:pimeloyl-ACP methyl ester carboxylesterase
MDYLDLHRLLKTSVRPELDLLRLEGGLSVSHLDFRSRHGELLPGAASYACSVHGPLAVPPEVCCGGTGSLDVQDSHVRENQAFRCAVFHREARARKVLLLFHGFNEKHWHKYLPWAHRLAEATDRAVLLFPIAFHMNRAPLAWSEHRSMHRASEQRKAAHPEVIGASLSNVAISTRIQARPQRFVWSGLQTYCDVVALVRAIREDRHPLVAPEARVDFLGYSIGCLLAQVLLMTDPDGLFSASRLGMFCGGAVFNRMSPVTKFILDSAANVALYSFVVEHLESHLRSDARLRHYLAGEHPEGLNFRSMLDYRVMRKEREARFRELAPRLLAIALEQDAVIPPYEVIHTLHGSGRDIPVPVEVLDFPYAHVHEDPFPASEALRGPVDEAFRRVFDRFAAFYGG